MGNTFNMPKSFGEFCDEYAFKDSEERYTNGSELVPTFRVKQWLDMNGRTDYADGFSDGYRAGSNYRELGCEGCAFEAVEDWEMPCAKCMRGCKDYYRHKPSDEE